MTVGSNSIAVLADSKVLFPTALTWIKTIHIFIVIHVWIHYLVVWGYTQSIGPICKWTTVPYSNFLPESLTHYDSDDVSDVLWGQGGCVRALSFPGGILFNMPHYYRSYQSLSEEKTIIKADNWFTGCRNKHDCNMSDICWWIQI